MKSVKVLVVQSCLILCDPMDGSPPGSSVHGILQPRILGWVTTIYKEMKVTSQRFSSEGVFPFPRGQRRLPRGQIIPSDTSEWSLHPLLEMTISPLFSGKHPQEIVCLLVFLKNIVGVEVWKKMKFQS